MKTVKAILSADAEVTLIRLSTKAENSKREVTLVRGFHKKVEMIKSNIHYGDKVEHRLWPIEYTVKYNVNNIFRVELPGFWRLTYTLKNGLSENEIVVLILDIMDHKTYNKKFGY